MSRWLFKPLTMPHLLKIVFALYAFNSAFHGLRNAVRYGYPVFWLSAGVSLCLLPVAWGLIRERKWAWNCAVGLVLFKFIWALGQSSGLLLSRSVDITSSTGIVLRSFAVNLGISAAILSLLILTRGSYQSASAVGERNGYLRPVCAGLSFLLMGLLALLHPAAHSAASLRMVALAFAAYLWIGAALCFFESPWRRIRLWAISATAVSALGGISSLTFYAYFALLGMGVGLIQVMLGCAAIFATRKPLQAGAPANVAAATN